MRPALAFLVLMLLPGCAAQTAEQRATADAAAASRIAQAVAGRTAGKPQSCINLHDIRSSRIVDSVAILYETSSRLMYVNRPEGGCPALRTGRTIVTRTPTTQLCRGDIVRLIDPPSTMEYGSCGLGDFVPYRK